MNGSTLQKLTMRRLPNRKKVPHINRTADDLLSLRNNHSEGNSTDDLGYLGNNHSQHHVSLLGTDSNSSDRTNSQEKNNKSNTPSGSYLSPPESPVGPFNQISLSDTKKEKNNFSYSFQRKNRFDSHGHFDTRVTFGEPDQSNDTLLMETSLCEECELEDEDDEATIENVKSRLVLLPIILEKHIGYKIPIDELNSASMHSLFTLSMTEDKVEKLNINAVKTEQRIKELGKGFQRIDGKSFALEQTGLVIEAKIKHLDQWIDHVDDASKNFKIELVEMLGTFFTVIASLFLLIWHNLDKIVKKNSTKKGMFFVHKENQNYYADDYRNRQSDTDNDSSIEDS